MTERTLELLLSLKKEEGERWFKILKKRVVSNEFLEKVIAQNKFSGEQMYEIRTGLEKGFTEEQILLYAKTELDIGQMYQIMLGFDHGLSYDKVELYAKQEFYADQMEQIRLGLEAKLTLEQVKQYAKLEFSTNRMRQMRWDLQHLNAVNKKEVSG